MAIRVVPYPALALDITGQMTGGGILKDYGGNLLKSYVMNNRSGGQENITIKLARIAPDGKLTVIDVEADDEWKIEGPTGDFCLDGANVLIGVLMHRKVEPRTLMPGFATVPNVAVPYPKGVDPRSGAGAATYRFAATPASGGEDVDYEKVRLVIREELVNQNTASRAQLRQDIFEKSKDAALAVWNTVLGYDNRPSNGTIADKFWQKLGERIYATLTDWWPKRDPK